jgi:hypothetical protein
MAQVRDRAVQALATWLNSGINAAMNAFNITKIQNSLTKPSQ